MTPNKTCQILLALGGAIALAAPASATDEVEIRKVNYTDLTYERVQRTSDPMIGFERRRLLFGAITTEDYRARRGKYFTVLWKAQDTAPGIVVRFEYLQSFTGAEIHLQEVTADKVERNNATDFQVTGRDFTGEWTWPDGRKLTDSEYDSYIRALRAGEPIEIKATPTGGGDVVAWKVSLVRDGAVLTTSKSYLWRD